MARTAAPPVPRLDSIALFADVRGRDLARLESLVDTVTVPAGEVVVREGEPGRDAFVVLRGRVEVRVGGVVVATASPGDVVGEIAVLDFQPRSATVVAISDVDLLALAAPAFTTALTLPGVAARLLRAQSERLRATTARLAAAEGADR